MLTMYQQITIKTLHKQGKKKAQIARELGCHRNTVTNIINRDGVVDQQTRNKLSFFDTYQAQIKQWLDQKVTRVRIYELLVDDYEINQSYDSLCKYIQKQFPKKIEAYGVQITSPGEEVEIDFGYVGMQPTNDGTMSKTWVLVVTPSYSRNTYYQLCYNQKIDTLIQGMINSFEFLGGVPKRMKVDNMRTAILKNQHYDLQYNQDFLEFANHYQAVIIPCTPYHPHQKGKVESDVGFVKGNFFCARKFSSRNDMETRLRNWMINYANQRVHGTSKKVPVEVFLSEEKSTLQSFPENPFAFFNRGDRVVGKNCHINYQGNYYSIPSHLVGKTICIRYNSKILRVIYQSSQVALHQISHQRGQYITKRSHLPEHKCYSQTEYQLKYELKMGVIGEYGANYFKFLLTRQKSYWFRTTRSILGLAKEHGNEVVDLSLKRALNYQATSISIIKNIIHQKLYLLDQEPSLPKSGQTDMENTRVGTTSLIRDLNYYNQALFKNN